ncbi:MAG: class I SAM-dependent methyltransferase [Candidatus Altiarchaeota archaeon]|nr:class I SAM-dependent methyltransferase [Candidatus Altiarchaeota archaeon]
MSWINYFRTWARKYDEETSSYGYDPNRLIKPFLHLIGKRKQGLDVGCGTGLSLKVIETFCEKIVGIEPVEKMAKQAESKGFQVLRMKGEDLGQIKTKFDFISFFASIDYLDSSVAIKGLKNIITEDVVVFITIEPENKSSVVLKFLKNGFLVKKSITKRAYEGQNYVCVLFEKVKGYKEKKSSKDL